MKKEKNIETGKTIQKSYFWEFCMVFCIMLMLPVNISLMFSGQQPQDQKEGLEETEEETKKRVLESELEWKVLHELARTIPIDYEPETLKAQAVILRTNILADREEGLAGKPRRQRILALRPIKKAPGIKRDTPPNCCMHIEKDGETIMKRTAKNYAKQLSKQAECTWKKDADPYALLTFGSVTGVQGTPKNVCRRTIRNIRRQNAERI